MEWTTILVNLGSGGIGVAITLALTGYWNWRDRKATQSIIERNAIVEYVRESQSIVLWLWKNIDKVSIGPDDRTMANVRLDLGDYVERIQLLSILNLEVRSVVTDDQTASLIRSRTRALEKFYGVLGLGPQAETRPSDVLGSLDITTESQIDDFASSFEKKIEGRISDIFDIYSATLGLLLERAAKNS